MTEQQIQEKAKELVHKFYKELDDNDCYVRDGDCSIEFKDTRVVAKQCALILCDEVISLCDKWDVLKIGEPFRETSERATWQKIKQTINTL